jgi:hypothetical protein
MAIRFRITAAKRQTALAEAEKEFARSRKKRGKLRGSGNNKTSLRISEAQA